MPNKNAMWVSATTTAVNTQSNSLSASGNQPRQQQQERINVHEWALLLNKKHRDNTYKGYSADSNGGSYEGL